MSEGFPTRSLSGIYPMYEDVRKDIGEILDPSRLRYVVVPHFEANGR